MIKQIEFNFQQQKLEQDKILPPANLVLAKLEIDSADIKSISPRKKRRQYRAVINWLTKYKSKVNTSNLENIRGYLEAFYHLCEAEVWQKVSQLLSISLNLSTDREWHNDLGTWGYYQEQIELYNQLLGKVDSTIDAFCCNNLGNAHRALGKYEEAIGYHQQHFYLAEQNDDFQGVENALQNLGNVYMSLGDYARAIEYHQQSLIIAQEIKDSLGQGTILGNLGNNYYYLGEYQRAIDYHQKSYSIFQEVGDRIGEGRSMSSLGLVYFALGNYQ